MISHRHSRALTGALIASALLFALPDVAEAASGKALAGPDPCVSGQSCFTSVGDILNGQRHLLRDDHLLLGMQYCADGDTVNCFALDAQTIDLRTANSSIVSSRLLDNYGRQSDDSGNTSVKTLAGRMFKLPYDVVAFFISDSTLVITDPTPGKGRYPVAGDVTGGNNFVAGAMADFNGDGYADLAAVSAGFRTGTLGIVTARTPADASQGAIVGPLLGLPDDVDFSPGATSMAVGDFDGDGTPDIAVMVDFTQTLSIYRVDPKTLTVSLAAKIGLPDVPQFDASLSMAAGKFGNATHDQLVLVYADNFSGRHAKVASFDFDASLNPLAKDVYDTGVAGGFGGEVVVRGGRFDWGNSFDQVALKLNANQSQSRRIQILTLDESLRITPQPGLDISALACSSDLVAGNFDRMQPDPVHPGQTERDPNLQLAVLAWDCGNNWTIRIYNVDPANAFAVSAAASYAIPGALLGGGLFRGSLAAGDTETPIGRSLALGAPTKVAISKRMQPSVVLASPPMHVDFIAPASSGTPQVFNISAIPDGFFTQYQTEQSNSNQSSTHSTTSWSAGTSETVSMQELIGIPGIDSVTVQNKFSAQQQWKGSAENVHGTTSSTEFDVSQQTGFGDQLWYQESRLNIYIYPVIGQTGCPEGMTTCTDSQKVPLTVQFSGVDAVYNETVPGNNTEWYQPPWEPGNLLSYPGTFGQLLAYEPDLDPLSTNFTWVTDQSVFLEKTTWNTGTSDSQTTSFDQNYSFKDTFSVSGTVDEVLDNQSFTAKVSASGSFGFSNLHTAVTTLGKSTGIGVQKPGSFANPSAYQYFVTPYIYGQKRPGGVVNDLPLSTDVQTFGVLQSSFVVDPVRADAGGWWKQAYTQAPDVGLNHPTRWNVRLSDQTNPNDGTCLLIGPGTSNLDCASLAPSLPANPWLSEFHAMRGLFITAAESDGGGPQLETATAGDLLLLQARVHNFSLVAMPAGAQVHTRFYGMPWNNSNNSPAGASFLIGEAVTGAIAPFGTDSDTPNWQLVSIPQPFDTTPYADQYLAFWVVTWMQTPDGGLVGEVPGHGMTGVPGALGSFEQAAALGQSYSNNVGFYKLAFYVFPKESATAAGVTRVSTMRSGPGFSMDHLGVSPHRAGRGGKIDVSTSLDTGDEPISGGVTVVFYDGDPAQGGKAFDVERVVHMRPRDRNTVAVAYRSSVCGKHEIVAVAARGTASEQRRSTSILVQCP